MDRGSDGGGKGSGMGSVGTPSPPGAYERDKALASDENPGVRARLAARADVVPELLYFLAEDPDPAVRRSIAGNAATPAKARLLLVADEDEEVRARLAHQIARLAPGLSARETDRVRRVSYQVLEQLARDQVVRVRHILSEALKDVADAPPEVIRRLARDAEAAVAAPVLEFSPVLTDEDLAEIIATTSTSGTLSAISRRRDLSEPLADAIVDTDDVAAITVLLANPSAQVREDTLDRLVDHAPSHECWHGPLIGRPTLHCRAATRLAHFVADTLLKALTSRHDLDPETAAEVSRVVRQRIDNESRGRPPRSPVAPLTEIAPAGEATPTALVPSLAKLAPATGPALAPPKDRLDGQKPARGPSAAAPDPPWLSVTAADDHDPGVAEPLGLDDGDDDHDDGKADIIGVAAPPPDFPWRKDLPAALERARRLLNRGGLEETQIARLLDGGDPLFTAAALAARAQVPADLVMAVLDGQNPRDVIALTWKAGLSAAFAVRIQTGLANLPAHVILQPTAEGGFPLNDTTMDWQLALLADGAEKTGATAGHG